MKILSAKYSESPIKLSNHYHDCHQIIFITKGELEAVVSDCAITVCEGSLLILNRFEEHSVKATGKLCKRFTVRISAEDSGGAYDKASLLFEALINRSKSYGRVIDTCELREKFIECFLDIAKESEMGLELSSDMMSSVFLKILIMLCRMRPEIFRCDENASYEAIRKIREKLENSFSECITLASLASEFHISPSYLSHLFKNLTGYAPIDYLMACRVSAAKQKLASTDTPVKEIVYLCGFGDESNFSRTFKKRTGMSPSEFRRKYGAREKR